MGERPPARHVLLDAGANVDVRPEHLVQFAHMGAAFMRAVGGVDQPRVRLLANGTEPGKGTEATVAAHEALDGMEGFAGNVEGFEIATGEVDVLVTDGFTGNVALKTGEGALRLMRDLLRQVFTSSVPARMGYLMARPALDRLREWMDPRRYNGAILLGLNGVVVKSHGSTDAFGFAHAMDVAMDMVNHGFQERIREGLARLSSAAAPPRPSIEPPRLASAGAGR